MEEKEVKYLDDLEKNMRGDRVLFHEIVLYLCGTIFVRLLHVMVTVDVY